MDTLRELYDQYIGGLLGGINIGLVVAFVLVTAVIGWVLTQLTRILRSAAVPILVAAVVVVGLLALAGYGISVSQ